MEGAEQAKGSQKAFQCQTAKG